MQISFSPQRCDDTLSLEKSSGDRLRINGELFNFNPLNDGDVIPAGAIPCEWIIGPVEKIDGVVHVTVKLPVPGGSTIEPWQAFPQPETVEDDGPVDIPRDTVVEIFERRATDATEIVRTIDRWRQEVKEQVLVSVPDAQPEGDGLHLVFRRPVLQGETMPVLVRRFEARAEADGWVDANDGGEDYAPLYSVVTFPDPEPETDEEEPADVDA